MAFVNEHLDGDDRQTIDRQRNIILKRTGIFHPDFSTSFSLSVDDSIIGFEAFRRTEPLPNKKMKVMWDVQKIYLNPPFDKNPSKARELIAEALDAYGFTASRTLVDSVDINFLLSL